MAKSRIKYLLFLIINILLYFFFGKNFLFLLGTSIFTYYVGKIIYQKHSFWLIIFSLFLVLLPLIFFKYLMNIMELSFVVPLGISYYTLAQLSYLSDMYHKRYVPSDNIMDFFIYTFYFPCLFIGPINRYHDFSKQIKEISIKCDNVILGIIRIMLGLVKKLIIANKLGVITAMLANDLSLDGGYVLFGLFLYSIELYCDFSGGIDIVLGISKIFNIELFENFNHPFKSESVKEFWRRWHITLGSWLKDYIYIPLGGSRVSKVRTKINVIITFVISGLWHGIHFILWGLINGILVSFELKTKNRYFNIILTFVFISFLWIFFIYPDTITSIKMFITIFTKFDLSFVKNIFNLGLNIYEYLIVLISIIGVLFYENKKEKIEVWFLKRKIEYQLIIILILIVLILLFGNYGLDVNSNNFIYGNF